MESNSKISVPRHTVVQRAASLSKAAASFSQIVGQDGLCAKAAHLQSASRNVARLLNESMAGLFEDGHEASGSVQAALAEIKAAFEELAASYEPPTLDQWRTYVAWHNLIAVYGDLDL